MSIARSFIARPTAAAAALVVLVWGLAATSRVRAGSSAPLPAQDAGSRPTLERAQRFFYNGQYDRAGVMSRQLCADRPDDLGPCELRTASLLFQIKRALKATGTSDRATAWNQCASCPEFMSRFVAETARSQAVARASLKAHPDDDTLFFLGKIDLNYVWLQLGTLGRKTGWDEYREARRSLDQVLLMNPGHVRARVARAWIDYIVGTTVPRGVRWLLGGGNKKRGLLTVRDVVAEGGGDFFVQTEARFALWDMQVRERDIPAAMSTARMLARDFPENVELRAFLADHDPATERTSGGGTR